MTIKIEKNIDYTKVDFILVTDKSYFPDDRKGSCIECKKEIVYRPYIPIDIAKICIECFNKKYE